MRASRMLRATVVILATSPPAVLAQGSASEGVAEPSLFDVNTGLSFWTLIVFAGLLFLLGKFAWGPILAAVEAREKRIQSALDEAAARNAEAERLLQEHREQLADARRQASEVLADARVAGDRVRKEVEEKARGEARALVERARAEIGRERDAALETLRREAIDLALAAASKLLEKELDAAKDRELVERYLGDLARDGSARSPGAEA